MRIAIISDIHSNLQALEKALSLIDGMSVTEIVCLGDIVGYGGNPNECVDLVRQRASRCVIGNHDAAALDTTRSWYFTKDGRTAIDWTHKVLTKESSEYLSSLPFRIEADHFTLVHANPAEPETWAYVSTLEEASAQFDHFKTSLCFIGHTHIPSVCGEDLKTFILKDDIRFLINVGSVGQPRDHNPQLSFGLLDTDAWVYENVRADYDVHGAAQAILDNALPRALAQRLFNGV
jgi:putative phosphoesterase